MSTNDTEQKTKIINAVTDLQWGVATMEPHGIIAAFSSYGPAVEYWQKIILSMPDSIPTFLIRLSALRVEGRRMGTMKQL